MSFKRWLVLLAVYLCFMIAGAVMFLFLEQWYELQERKDLHILKKNVMGVVGALDNSTREEVVRIVNEIGDECSHDFLTLKEDTPLTWTLWNSFFFTFTVITTIGFGHMAPKTMWGRIACISYAFIGVPLNGILVASLADIFSSRVMHWDVRQWASRYKTWVTVVVDSIVFLVPGLVVFLVIPSLVLMEVEDGWTYLDAFYFSFITLTTIGFGDHVAGQQERDHVWVWVYKVVMVVWIIFGLGYIIMIITFVQKALKSKKILNLEKKMASALKKHVVRVHRDLGTVRRAINNKNRVYPEEDGDEKNNRKRAKPSQKLTLELDALTDSPRPSPRNHGAPCTRPRSASESDLFAPSLTHREELEGMNAMLDFIERLLHHQETRALTTFDRLLYHHHHHDDDGPEEEEEEEATNGGSARIDLEKGGCVNSGFIKDQDELSILKGIVGVGAGGGEAWGACRRGQAGDTDPQATEKQRRRIIVPNAFKVSFLKHFW
ncbi:open rectifier potassium channel protein 1-like isoform X1 [Scylla paramamosain]|uniref:open rectifier potassium channel protein 1-like isoform X1 n=1 Tax=Scylla paramamosain TaxID=85552 RepID=UPI003082B379